MRSIYVVQNNPNFEIMIFYTLYIYIYIGQARSVTVVAIRRVYFSNSRCFFLKR